MTVKPNRLIGGWDRQNHGVSLTIDPSMDEIDRITTCHWQSIHYCLTLTESWCVIVIIIVKVKC